MTAFAQELEAAHPDSVFVVCHADLSSAEDAQGLVPTVLLKTKLAGKTCPSNVEILVLNAGLGLRRTSIDEVTLEDLRSTLDVNVVAPFLLCQAVLPAMRKAQWGRIIANSSISGQSGTSANAAHYAARCVDRQSGAFCHIMCGNRSVSDLYRSTGPLTRSARAR